MTRQFTGAIAALLLGTGLVTQAHAVAITPQFDRFGELPGTEFGGDGIPNDAVAITEVDLGGNGTLTLGLTATERFQQPAVGNDGAGTFFAPAGPFSSGGDLARWNFDFFAGTSDGADASGFSFELLYDLDPGAGTNASALGVLDPTGYTDSDEAANDPNVIFANSQNAGFDYLENSIPGFSTAPDYGLPFDPTADGEYTFALRALDANGGIAGQAAINVIVGDGPTAAVAEPSAFALFSLALAGLLAGLIVRRRGGNH